MTEHSTSMFDWGETVKVKNNAPIHLNPGQVGSICGMRQISSEEGAKIYLCHKNDWVYTVEYIGGLDKEIAEIYLEKYPEKLKYITKEKIIMNASNPQNYYSSQIAEIIDFCFISEESLAKKFKLKIGDPIYVLKSENGEEFLAPESYIDKRVDS